MSRILRYLTPLLAAGFVALLGLNAYYALSSSAISRTEASGPAKAYHFAFFLPEADYSFFRDLRKGAVDASRIADCSISFHPIDLDPVSLEMASFSGIDGLAVYPYGDEDQLRSVLTKVYDSGIPIVQIENQVLVAPTSVLIGTNGFDFGKAIGRLALQSGIERLNIALVYSDKNPGLMADGSLLEMGMKSILEKRISALRSTRTSMNLLDAEKLTYELTRSPEAFNLIVFTDTNDTLVAVQAIIDMNLVGAVQMIGFGNDQAISTYVDKGILLGSIVRDPQNIGFSAVLALAEIKRSGNTSAYVDTGISVIDKGNAALGYYEARR